ncbi:MAG: hypothetical protein M1821_005317 [Bathelium mastoideum]|nr:MAG: hypothetical protein M1821_005317 [Bathelium mastoideum]
MSNQATHRKQASRSLRHHYQQEADTSPPPGIPLMNPSVDAAANRGPPSDDDEEEAESRDVSDVDELDPLNNDSRYARRKSGRRLLARTDTETAPFHGGPPIQEKLSLNHRTSSRRLWRRWCGPTRTCRYILLFVISAIVVLLSAGSFWVYNDGAASPYGESEPYYPTPKGGIYGPWTEAFKKAHGLVRQMTLPEKVNITTGVGWSMEMCVGNTGAVPRLSFPSLCLQDGPLGLRFADHATAWPAGLTVGATWNKDLMRKRGQAQALEARLKGINIILGPSMGPLGRLPAGGRNWEGFSPDPVLAGWAASQTIRGIQGEGVIATAKHYIGNEQEHFRQAWEWGLPNAISSNIDDRTLHELYAWPFMDSVASNVGSVMCSYNQVNNSYACQNSKLLNGILKDELGFQGFVQSDWLAQRSGVASALAGLDMTMPGDGLVWANGESLWGKELTKAVLNGSVPIDRLNDMVSRIVAAWYFMGQDNSTIWPEADGGPNFSSWTNNETGLLHPGSDDKATGVVNKFLDVQNVGGNGPDSHQLLARIVATEGTVVLENVDNILPLSHDGWLSKEISSTKNRKYRVGIFGEDAVTNPKGANACEDRGCNVGTLGQGWGSGTAEYPYLISPVEALRQAFNNETVELTESLTNVLPSSSVISKQDLCLVFVNSDGGEGYLASDNIQGDRNNLALQKGGDKLIMHVASYCGGDDAAVIVVVHAVGPVVVESWIDHPAIKGVIFAHLPSQESGSSLADILFGDVNPSGRLPYTVGKSLEDYGPGAKILYKSNGLTPQQNFTEGLYIDYRYFDKNDIIPRYEFGYGLSYTEFELSGLRIEHVAKNNDSFPVGRPHGSPPPMYPAHPPNPQEALLPVNFTKIKKYIYPWLDSLSEIKKGRYEFPRGYTWNHPPPPAGGGLGGHPDLWARTISVQVNVTNTGPMDGASVVQLYIGFPADVFDFTWNATHFANCTEGMPNEPSSANETNPLNSFIDSQGRNITSCSNETMWKHNPSVDFPVRVLRGFERAEVSTGSKRTVTFDVSRRDLSYWDVGAQNWRLPDGEFEFAIGFSSRNLPLKAKCRVIGTSNGLVARDGSRGNEAG